MRGAHRGAGLAARGFGAVVTLTDLLPPRIRYGYVHRVTTKIFSRPLPTLPAIERMPAGREAVDTLSVPADLTGALVTDHLDVGGIGAVIETLARGLPRYGVRPIVVCPGDGARAARLRAHGVEVRCAASAQEAVDALRGVDVIALHSAPDHLERCAIESDLPLVTVMHNTEIHFTRRRWITFRELLSRSVTGVAVSETVREFHIRHVPAEIATRIRVVPNGATAETAGHPRERDTARNALAAAVNTPLRDDVVFACLARYDSQKNVAGTVASFLHAVESGLTGARLVYAGDPSDWAELRRADAIRLSSAHGDRVHLLGNSHASTLLLAADVFLLNSFFEGWAVAATEAAASGMPLVLSEVGGAAELIAFDGERSVLIPNAVGDAGSVTDARVVSARRHSRHQSNRADLAKALAAVASRVRADPERRVPPAIRTSTAEMIGGHADALREARDAHVAIGDV